LCVCVCVCVCVCIGVVVPLATSRAGIVGTIVGCVRGRVRVVVLVCWCTHLKLCDETLARR
jgi:hypothetical protein